MDKESTLAEFLAYKRREHNYTQQDLAKLLGIERSTYAYYENGKTDPAIDIIKKLANIYNISIDEMLLCRKSRSEIVRDTKITLNRSKSRNIEELTDMENEVLSYFRKLTESEKERVIRTINDNSSNSDKADKTDKNNNGNTNKQN